MQFALVVFGGTLLGILFLWYLGRKPELSISVGEIPKLLTALKSAQDQSFAVLSIESAGSNSKEADGLNIQFSIEGRRVGLDWVLVSPANINDEPRVVAFLQENQCTIERHKVRGVEYLRVVDRDLASLSQQMLNDLYGIESGRRLSLIAEGFQWTA